VLGNKQIRGNPNVPHESGYLVTTLGAIVIQLFSGKIEE